MCEWLSIPSTEMAEKGASGGRCSREASSAPPVYSPQIPSHLWLLQAPCPRRLSSLARTLLPSSPISQPGGDFLPGTSYIPSRAAYSSVGLVSPLLGAGQPRLQQVPRGPTRHAAGDLPAPARPLVLWEVRCQRDISQVSEDRTPNRLLFLRGLSSLGEPISLQVRPL